MARSSPHLTNILPPPVWIWRSLMSEIIPPHRLSLQPWFPLVVSLILAARRALLGPRSGFLAPLVQQRVAGGVDVFDFHLVVIHAHGGQSAGHLLLWQEDRRVSGTGVQELYTRYTFTRWAGASSNWWSRSRPRLYGNLLIWSAYRCVSCV